MNLPDALDLIDSQQCTPACLLADDTSPQASCDCRCKGAHHGDLRHAAHMASGAGGLAGQYLHTFTPCARCGPIVDRQGVVRARLPEGAYLVQWFDWFAGEPAHSSIHRIDEMAGWRFYDTSEDMQFAYEHRGLSARSERHLDCDRLAGVPDQPPIVEHEGASS